MDNSKRTIIILIVLVSILTVALIGAIAYIFINENGKTNNKDKIVVNTSNNEDDFENELNDEDNENNIVDKSEEIAIRSFNAQFTAYEGNENTASQIKSLISAVDRNNTTMEDHQVSLNTEGITTIEEVDNTKKYSVELSYDDDGYVIEITIKEYTESGNEGGEPSGDMDKLLFNSIFTPYLGEITGTQLMSLLKAGQEASTKYPEHPVQLTSKNPQDLAGINPTDTYIVTLTYDSVGYVNSINVDKKI